MAVLFGATHLAQRLGLIASFAVPRQIFSSQEMRKIFRLILVADQKLPALFGPI